MQTPVLTLERRNITGGDDLHVVQHSHGNICDDGRRAAAIAAYEYHAATLFNGRRSGGCLDAFDDDAREFIVCEHIPLHVDPRSAADGSLDVELARQVDDRAPIEA